MAAVAFLLLSAGLFTVVAGDYCRGYMANNKYVASQNCYVMYCCGTCDNRYCCPFSSQKLSDSDQNVCTITNSTVAIAAVIVGLVIIIGIFIVCCCCPCCCIYNMCKTRRPVAGAHVTTVVSNQCVQQQNTSYQPVPTQPGYGVQPVQMGPSYQPQPYAPGPPPSYHTAVNPGYPTTQAAYPLQPGIANLPSETSTPYNPAYMQPPKPGY